MELSIYQIDTFTDKLFCGNPAAVCPLDKWLPDSLMQSIATENNLSETAFYTEEGNAFHIRWFTPTTEVDLCGHATLATAYVLFHCLDYASNTIEFKSRSGTLKVSRNEDVITLNFPLQRPIPCETPSYLAQAFSSTILASYKAEDYILLLKNEAEILNAEPDLERLKMIDLRGVAITSQAKNCDFVTRFFAPKYGIDEDPVTGSAFTQLAPFWSEKLAQKKFSARQLSARGGRIICESIDNRVYISGQAVLYMRGFINIEP